MKAIATCNPGLHPPAGETARHAHAGMGFDDIQMELGIATQCGRCEDCARAIVAQCSVGQPQAALQREACAPSGVGASA